MNSNSNDYDEQQQQQPPKPEKKKNTMFERALDDFIGKRYGAGEAFYGKRTSALSEDEYEKTQKPKRVYDKDAPMKDNSILIVGGIDEIGQWLAYELNDKGFNVRVACASLKEASDIFGFPGFNADIIELKGDESDEKTYAQAINGVQAIILCSNFNPEAEWGSNGNKLDVEVSTARNIVNIAQKARQAEVGEVKKIVHISRVVPAQLKCSTDPITAWTDKVADNDIYTKFRSRHEQVEEFVRTSQFDYTIVRAPPVVLEARPPAIAPLTLLSAQETEAVVTPKESGNFLTSLFNEQVPGAKIGVLDLAEVAIQCLLQEVNDMTFSIFETDTVDATKLLRRAEIISGQRELETTRISRQVSMIRVCMYS